MSKDENAYRRLPRIVDFAVCYTYLSTDIAVKTAVRHPGRVELRCGCKYADLALIHLCLNLKTPHPLFSPSVSLLHMNVWFLCLFFSATPLPAYVFAVFMVWSFREGNPRDRRNGKKKKRKSDPVAVAEALSPSIQYILFYLLQ